MRTRSAVRDQRPRYAVRAVWERCPSGRRSTPGKCVYGNVSRVRIPPSPPTRKGPNGPLSCWPRAGEKPCAECNAEPPRQAQRIGAPSTPNKPYPPHSANAPLAARGFQNPSLSANRKGARAPQAVRPPFSIGRGRARSLRRMQRRATPTGTAHRRPQHAQQTVPTAFCKRAACGARVPESLPLRQQERGQRTAGGASPFLLAEGGREALRTMPRERRGADAPLKRARWSTRQWQ